MALEDKDGKIRYVCQTCGHVERRWPSYGSHVKSCRAKQSDPTTETTNRPSQCRGVLIQTDATLADR